MVAMLSYGLLVAAAAIGLIGGTEIGMITIAGIARYRWKRAWRVTLAGLLTFIPIILLLYLFFTALPRGLATLAAGIVILVLGAYFLYEGVKKRMEGDEEEEGGEFASLGLVGIYLAIFFEEVEEGSIAISIGAAGGSYISAIIGMAIGIIVPLLAIRQLRPYIERMPEWLVHVAVGSVMVVVALLIIIYRF